MKFKKLHLSLLAFAVAVCNNASAQLYIDNAQFTIQSGATVTVQGDVTSNTDILGPGKLTLGGTANQNVNMGGFSIPNLEMSNTANATLTGNVKIGTSLLFTNGKIAAGNFNFILSDVATVSGQGTGKFVETNGTGQVRKLLTGNVTNSELPLGYGTNYQPAFVTSSGSYAAGAYAGAQVIGAAHPNKHPRATDYLNEYWPITQSGITGTLRASGKYFSNFAGTESDLRGIIYTAGNWSLANANINTAADTTAALIPAGGADLYAMNRFVLSKTKVFLQGAFNTAAGLNASIMNDSLRRPTNLIPTSDPYRTSDYSATFIQVNNPDVESTTAFPTVFNNQASTNDDIVDWVFLELRRDSLLAGHPGSVVIATRSALLQRDGDIVDVDGVSPVYFKNQDSQNGFYTVAVRHRNHLGIATDPVANRRSLSEANPASVLDFTTITDANAFGTANAFKSAAGGKMVLWMGNASVADASGIAKVKYSGSSNDPGFILTKVLAFPGNTSQLYNYNAAIGYFSGDVNMDRKVKYAGSSNDPGTILTNVLAYPGNASQLYNYNAFTQQLPQ